MVGAYAMNTVFYDLATYVVAGFVGHLMLRSEFPVAPMASNSVVAVRRQRQALRQPPPAPEGAVEGPSGSA